MYNSITIISDCTDDNAICKQKARYGSLFPGINISYIKVSTDLVGTGNYEASGNLVDIIDSFLGGKNLIVVNVAPRSGTGKKWENGVPFGYFDYNGNTIISVYDEITLSLVNKLGVLDKFYLTDIPEVLSLALDKKIITSNEKYNIENSQFRSFEYLPRLAFWLYNKSFDIPNKQVVVNEYFRSDYFYNKIWFIDNFGNCKTNILKKEFDIKKVGEKFRKLKYYKRLKDVSDNEIAFTTGSSGYKNDRFIEIVHQGKRCCDSLELKVGEEIYTS